MASINVLSTIGSSANIAGNSPASFGSGDGKSGQAAADFTATMDDLLARLGLGGQNSEADPVTGGEHKPGAKNGMQEDPLMAALLTVFGSLLFRADLAGMAIRSDFPAGKEANSGKVNGDAKPIESLMLNSSLKGWNLKLGTGVGGLSVEEVGAQRAGMQPLGQGENPTLVSELDKDRIQDLLTALSGQIKIKTGITPEVQQVFDRTLQMLSGLNLDPNGDSKAQMMSVGLREGGSQHLKSVPDKGLGQGTGTGTGIGLASASGLGSASGFPIERREVASGVDTNGANARFGRLMDVEVEPRSIGQNDSESILDKGLTPGGRVADQSIHQSNNGLMKGIGIKDPETAMAGINAETITVRGESKASGVHTLIAGTEASQGSKESQTVSYRDAEAPSKGFSQEGQGHNPGIAFTSNSLANGVSTDLGMQAKNDTIPVWQQITNSINEHLALRKEGSLRRPLVQELEIQLHPAELGKIQIALRWDDGTIHLQVQASDRGTGTMLQNHLSDLRQSLQDAGVSCGMMQMDFGGERRQRSYQEMAENVPKRLTEMDMPVSRYAQGMEPVQLWETSGLDGHRINIMA